MRLDATMPALRPLVSSQQFEWSVPRRPTWLPSTPSKRHRAPFATKLERGHLCPWENVVGLGALRLLAHQSLETFLGLHQRNMFLVPRRVKISDALFRLRDEFATLVDFDFRRWFLRRCPSLRQICLKSLHDWPLEISHSSLDTFVCAISRATLGLIFGLPSGGAPMALFGCLQPPETPLVDLFGDDLWPMATVGLRTWSPENIDCHPLATLAVSSLAFRLGNSVSAPSTRRMLALPLTHFF